MLKHFQNAISIILFFFVTSKLFASTNLALQHMSFEELNKHFAVQLDKSKPLTRQINSLRFVQKRIDENHTKHIRLQQYYLDTPILGGAAIIHQKNDNVQKINGLIYEDLNNDLGDTPPYTENLAKNILQKFMQKWQSSKIISHKTSPIIFINNKPKKSLKAHWSYLVELTIVHDNAPPEKPTAIIDANTQDLLVMWDNIRIFSKSTAENKLKKDSAGELEGTCKSHHDSRTESTQQFASAVEFRKKSIKVSIVNGLGFGGNYKTGLIQFGKDLPYLTISHDNELDICYMENPDVKVIDMQNHYLADNSTIVTTCPYAEQENAYWTGYNQDGYDKINGAYSTSNDALYIANTIKDMYKKTYKVEPLIHKNQPQQLLMRVHYGRNYANAFWDGTQMSFGDGDYYFYPLVSMGIGAHEISHGFTEQHSNLVYFGQSGAINESFSDMAAQAAEYYLNKTNSWKIGHDIVKNSSGISAIRFMDKPSLDKHSIEFAHHYRDDMDVHYSSGVYNKLFYLIATTNNWTTEKAFKIMLKANMDYWTPTSSFKDAACGIIYAAKDLKYSITDIKNALEEVIIDYDDC